MVNGKRSMVNFICPYAACGGKPTFFFTLFPVMEKGAKDQADFFLPTFSLMKKLAKNQADGKCSRTGSYAPTVGLAPARINMAVIPAS